MSDRNAFLDRIRAAVAKGRAHHVALNPHATHTAAYVGGGADPVATLLREWQAVGGRGERVQGTEAARSYVQNYCRERQIRRALTWRHPVLDRLQLDVLFRDLGVATVDSNAPAEPAEVAGLGSIWAADLGVTSVDWAVAETGTLALCSRTGQPRAASLAPPRYLAIVEPAQIVPDLFDLFDRLEAEKRELPSNIVLVTGPSKTGDIELKLTTGVHGPGDVTLLVVEP
ncbi:MAG: LutC/YkgG family protein [Planctomycetaceae bacterium]